MPRSSKYLVLVDLNGVLCYRTEEPVAGARWDLAVRRKFYYRRHGVNDFIQRLVDSGQFEVGVYSSIMAHNLEAGLNAIMTPRQRSQLVAVLDRDMNKPDPQGENAWDTVRDMTKVWAHLGHQWDASNTILCDNEARKFQDHPDNGIVVPEFGPAEVQARKAGTLDSLGAYLLEMGRARPGDVRAYLRKHPFQRTYLRPLGAQQQAPAAPPAAAPAAARRPEAAAAAAAAADDLAAALLGLSVAGQRPTSAAPPAARAAASSSAGASSAAGAQEPRGSEGLRAGPPLERDEELPEGVRLQLACVDEDGRFTMTGSSGNETFTVRGPSGRGLRVDAKTDLRLLVQTAREAGCELSIERHPRGTEGSDQRP